MKYIAVRVQKTINNDFVIQGQKNTDYNWETLEGCSGNFNDKIQAENAALCIGKSFSSGYHCYIPVYNCGGYGIGGFYKGKPFHTSTFGK